MLSIDTSILEPSDRLRKKKKEEKEKERKEKERGKDKERRKEKEKLQPQFSLMKIVYTVNGDLQRGNWLYVGAEGG